MYGIRALSMFTSLHPLRHGRCLTRVFPSCTFKEIRNLSQTSWSSVKILNQLETRTIGSFFIRPTADHFSSQPNPFEERRINNVILSLKTIKEQLELFERIKNSASIVNRVTMLHRIAKIIERNGNQSQVLEKEKGKSIQALNSAYLTLLDSISKDIAKCQPRGLANVMWALGKLEEKDHELVQVCERAVLSLDITAFSNAGICQIVSGCINLDLTATEISSTLQESIRNGQLKLSNFNNQVLSAMVVLFAKSDGRAIELFDIFLEEILSRDFLLMESAVFAQFVWSFAKKELNADTLFDRVEEEILRRGTASFRERHHIVQILWAFSKAKKGGKQLFYIMDNELISRGVKGFSNSALLQIVWSFATRDVTNAKVFDLVKDEVFNRGVGMFKSHELVLILYSLVFAQQENIKLVEEIESELLSRDVEQFRNSQLCQVAWSLGRAKKSDSKIFDVIEESVFQRGLHQFSKSQKFLLLRGYVEAKRGSRKLYEGLQVSFLKSCFSDLTATEIYQLAWYFPEAEKFTGPLINTGQLFDTLEREILTKGKLFFTEQLLNPIKMAFRNVGKGSKELLEL